MNIENRIALVTGGADGIGLAIVTELLRSGVAHVAILDLENSNGEGVAIKLNREFGQKKTIFLICDVTKPQKFEDAFTKTVEQFGGLDIVINNAGIANETQLELMTNINYNAVVRGTLLGFKNMAKDKGGKGGVIVNMASILGVTPFATAPIYTGLKHAVVGFSRSFGLPYHYEKTGVRVLAICPGFTTTKMTATVGHHSLGILDPETMAAELKDFAWQKVESVAHSTVSIIQSAQNGSVWILEGAEPAYEIFIPDRQAMKIARSN